MRASEQKINWIVSYKEPPVPGDNKGKGDDMKPFPDKEAAMVFALDKCSNGFIVEAMTAPDISPEERLTNTELEQLRLSRGKS